MSNQMYIGDADNVARRVYKAFIGDSDDTARSIIKAYIGGNDGYARCAYSPEIEAYGTIEHLSKPRANLATTTVGDYVIFAGGKEHMDFSDYDIDSMFTAYSKHLTRMLGNTYKAHVSGYDLAATTVGDIALFCGGRPIYEATWFSKEGGDVMDEDGNINYPRYNSLDSVEAFDASLTNITNVYGGGPYLGYPRRGLAAITVGDYALFAGGADCLWSRYEDASEDLGYRDEYTYKYYNTIDAFGKDLVRVRIDGLSANRAYLAAANVGKYAIFAGGMHRATLTTWQQPGDALFLAPTDNTVDAYDRSLTKITISQLSEDVCYLSAVSTPNKAVFFGGIRHVSGNPVTTYGSLDTGDMRYSDTEGVHIYSSDLVYQYLTSHGGRLNDGFGIGAVAFTKDGVGYIMSAGGRPLSNAHPYDNLTVSDTNPNVYERSFYSDSRSAVKSTRISDLGMNVPVGSELHSLKSARSFLAGAANGEYVFFAGGADGYGDEVYSDTVDVYRI